MIYQDYADTGKKYKTTGDPVYEFMNPIPLEEYVPPNAKDPDGKPLKDEFVGYWNVNMSPRALKEFLKLTEEARKIDDKVFKYMEEEMKKEGKSGTK